MDAAPLQDVVAPPSMAAAPLSGSCLPGTNAAGTSPEDCTDARRCQFSAIRLANNKSFVEVTVSQDAMTSPSMAAAPYSLFPPPLSPSIPNKLKSSIMVRKDAVFATFSWNHQNSGPDGIFPRQVLPALHHRFGQCATCLCFVCRRNYSHSWCAIGCSDSSLNGCCSSSG